MRGKALSFLVSFALGSWMALPLGAAEVWRGPSSLEVRVEDSSGKAVEGAKVRLLYQAVEPKSGPAIASTDNEGEAYFFSLAEGWWALEVTREGALSIHSEFVLQGEKKPAVLSTFQENTPGATQTLQVRIGRPRAGRAAGDPTGGPQVGKPAAPAPTPAVASAAQPAAPVTPTPVSVPEVKESPAAVPSAPPAALAPTLAPAAPSAPPQPAPAPAIVPAAPNAPTPSTPPARPALPPAAPRPSPTPSATTPQVQPSPPPVPTSPAPSAPAPVPPPSAPPVPSPTPAAPVVAPAPVAPATPAPAALAEPKAQRRSYAERSCLECKAGEEALSIEVSVPPGGAPCGDGLDARLRERDSAKAGVGLPPSCRLLRITLPPEARFTGYRYEVEDGGASRDCRTGADCPVGACRFPLDPGIRKGPTGTAFTAAFENTSPDRERRAIFTVYFAPE